MRATPMTPQPLRLSQTSPRYRELLKMLAEECTLEELKRLDMYDLRKIKGEVASRDTQRKEME